LGPYPPIQVLDKRVSRKHLQIRYDKQRENALDRFKQAGQRQCTTHVGPPS
jgi:hypothetical protein